VSLPAVLIVDMECRVVVAGDTGVGKSALINRFVGEELKEDVPREPHLACTKSGIVGYKTVHFTMQEISDISQAEVSPTLYESDVILLCFNISQPSTLRSIISHWVASLRLLAPSIPLLLIGCQSDLRNDRSVLASLAKQGKSSVSTFQALSVSRQLGAVMYVETETRQSNRSAVTAFEVAALTCMGNFHIPTPTGKQRSRSVTPRDKPENTSEFWDKFRSPIPKRRWSTKSPARPTELSSVGNKSGSLSNISLIRSKSNPLSDTNVLSIKTCSRPPRASRKSIHKDPTAKLIMIKCQRMTYDKTFEEIEIAVPLSVYDNLEPEGEITRNTEERKSFGSKLRGFFVKDFAGSCS